VHRYLPNSEARLLVRAIRSTDGLDPDGFYSGGANPQIAAGGRMTQSVV
jgi:hypothetical protein